MTANDVLTALVKAGVQMSHGIADYLECGETGLALIDAIALADEQQVVLPVDVAQRARAAFEALALSPRTTIRSRVDETLKRVEARSAANAA